MHNLNKKFKIVFTSEKRNCIGIDLFWCKDKKLVFMSGENMFKFLGNEMAVSIPEAQVREAVLYENSLYLKLFNGVMLEFMSRKDSDLEKIFFQLKDKNKFGNFINMKKIDE